jgi:hypothetical protein
MLTVIRLELTRVPPTSVESQYTASPATKFVPLIVKDNPLVLQPAPGLVLMVQNAGVRPLIVDALTIVSE